MSEYRLELQKTRRLIDNNQYTKAKRSLKHIDHPVATLWLKMLNHAVITTNMIITVTVILAIVAIIAGVAGYAISDTTQNDSGDVLKIVALQSMVNGCIRETAWTEDRCQDEMVNYSVIYGNDFLGCYIANKAISDLSMLECLTHL